MVSSYLFNKINNMNRRFIILTIALLIALAWGGEALAHDPGPGPGHGPMKDMRPGLERMHKERGVTPYGDFCPRCNLYGVGKKPVTHQVAMEALNDYFRQKGLTVRNIHGMGRFLKVDIYRDGRLVDRILFDRRTGRIRSIF